jgi:hypothetical protein
MPSGPNQILLVGGAVGFLNLEDYSVQNVGNFSFGAATFNFYADGRVEGIINDTGIMTTENFENWLRPGGNAADYEMMVELISGFYLGLDFVNLPPNTWVPIKDLSFSANAIIGTPISNTIEFRLSMRKVGTTKVLATSEIFLHIDNTANIGMNGLEPHTIRGIGSGSGSLAAVAGIEIRGDGTAWAYYTNDLFGAQVRTQLENWNVNGVNTILVNKVFNANKNLDDSSGVGKRIAIGAGSVLRWSAREPDNEDKVIGLQLDFFNGSSPVYSVRITLDADRRAGASNPGVT